jgi:hypothetical protein
VAVPSRPVAAAPLPFAAGEQLVYEVTWLGIVAGKAEMVVEPPVAGERPPAYRLVTTATSNEFMSRIFPVDDRMESLVEVARFRTLSFRKRLREGVKVHDEEVTFDAVRNVAVSDGREVPTPPEVQDALSAFYWMRTLPLEPGKSLQVPVHSGGRSYTLQVDVIARERIRTPFGERVAFKVEPHHEQRGVFDQRGRLLVWIADDAGRLPLLMKTSLPIGNIVVRLVEYRWGGGGGSSLPTSGAAASRPTPRGRP